MGVCTITLHNKFVQFGDGSGVERCFKEIAESNLWFATRKGRGRDENWQIREGELLGTSLVVAKLG